MNIYFYMYSTTESIERCLLLYTNMKMHRINVWSQYVIKAYLECFIGVKDTT